MKLSLSGRLVESSGGTIVPVRAFLDLAARYGYDAVDLRGTQLAPATPEAEVRAIRDGLEAGGLAVFEASYHGRLDAAGAEVFSAFAARLADLGAEAVRLHGDLAYLKRAARLAAPHGLRVVYQMHTGGAFETIATAAHAADEVDEPNFGVLPEPANLMLAGETFTETMLEPLRGRIFGVHVQTLEVRPGATDAVPLADGTEVPYERVPYARNRQIDFATFFAALRRVGFDGYVNELEPCPGGGAAEATVRQAASFLRRPGSV
jgi:sugar phosphate isomerase/epimerase